MPSPMDTAHLAAIRALVRTVDEGSIAAAARRLALTPSAVSKQLTRLEDALGVRLLERSTRRVRATAAGLALIEKARPLFEALDEAGQRIRDEEGSVHGRVRVSASRALGRVLLLPLAATLLREHKGLQLDLLLDGRRLDFLDDGIDVAIREGTLPDSSLAATKLGEAPVGLYASPSYLARRGAPASLDDLREHDLLSVAAQGPSTDIANLRGSGGKPLGLAARVRANDLLALADLAARDTGIAVLPSFVATDARAAGTLQRVLPRTVVAKLPVHAVHTGAKRLPRRVAVVLELLRRELPRLLKATARDS